MVNEWIKLNFMESINGALVDSMKINETMNEMSCEINWIELTGSERSCGLWIVKWNETIQWSSYPKEREWRERSEVSRQWNEIKWNLIEWSWRGMSGESGMEPRGMNAVNGQRNARRSFVEEEMTKQTERWVRLFFSSSAALLSSSIKQSSCGICLIGLKKRS